MPRARRAHFLSNIDVEARTGDCAVCGPVRLKKCGSGWRCMKAWRANNKVNRRRAAERTRHPWRRHKGATCERCGFEPEHAVQLDVHHVDGDKANNAAENLMTLCANCHRLVTQLEGGCTSRVARSPTAA